MPDPDPEDFGISGSESDSEDSESDSEDTDPTGEAGSGDEQETGEPDECFSVVDNLMIDDTTHPDSVSCVEHVLGDLVIGPTTQLLDLGMLANLREVDGSLFIGGNLSLTSLVGLDALEQVGWLQLRRNHNLSNLVGLDALTHLERLTVSNNEGMTSLVGLPEGLAPAVLEIDKNDLLPSLDGLPSFAPADDGQALHVEIRENPALIALDGLSECCASQPISLVVADNDALDDLDGLEGFTIMTSLELYDNFGLVDLDGLDQLGQLGTLLVDYDHCVPDKQPSLLDFGGAESLTHVGILHIERVASLTSLDGLHNVVSTDKVFAFNNVMLDPSEIEALIAATQPDSAGACGNLGEQECFTEMCPMF